MLHTNLNRRQFIKSAIAGSLTLSLPVSVKAGQAMATRVIPSTGQKIGVVGFGNTPIFYNESDENRIRTRELFAVLSEYGGNFIDTNSATVWNLEKWLDADVIRRVHIVTSFSEFGSTISEKDIDHLYQALEKKPLDFLQVRNMRSTDAMAAHWPTLKAWKADGIVKHIGFTVFKSSLYPDVEKILEKENPDFLQINYSFYETEAEQRLLPMAKEKGIAVFINRPFLNGDYFKRIRGKQLPEWAGEFDCESWAQFSVKWILAHPAVTCVLTETSKTKHARDNLGAGFGRLPDDEQRKRIREYIHSVARG